MKRIIEVCAADWESVMTAKLGGAARVELCCGLSESGFTPSMGLIKEALKTGMEVNVLVRPRGGNFIYNEAEKDAVLYDIEAVCRAGCHGVVIGALTAGGDVDTETCKRWIEAAQGHFVTFHRAFDATRDKRQALEEIISLGCRRVLTSGGAASAYEGRDMLAQLVKQAGERLTIMAGGGINPQNIAAIEAVGVKEFHASARERQHPDRLTTSLNLVQQLVNA